LSNSPIEISTLLNLHRSFIGDSTGLETLVNEIDLKQQGSPKTSAPFVKLLAVRFANFMIQNDNVESKAECVHLNLAHVAKTKSIKKTKTNKRRCRHSSVQVKICESSPEVTIKTMEEMTCERDEF